MIILHIEVEEELERMQDTVHVFAFLRKLEKYPGTMGDHHELDPRGNPIQFKVLKRHVLAYFRDPFADETRILSLNHVEKP